MIAMNFTLHMIFKINLPLNIQFHHVPLDSQVLTHNLGWVLPEADQGKNVKQVVYLGGEHMKCY